MIIFFSIFISCISISISSAIIWRWWRIKTGRLVLPKARQLGMSGAQVEAWHDRIRMDAVADSVWDRLVTGTDGTAWMNVDTSTDNITTTATLAGGAVTARDIADDAVDSIRVDTDSLEALRERGDAQWSDEELSGSSSTAMIDFNQIKSDQTWTFVATDENGVMRDLKERDKHLIQMYLPEGERIKNLYYQITNDTWIAETESRRKFEIRREDFELRYVMREILR